MEKNIITMVKIRFCLESQKREANISKKQSSIGNFSFENKKQVQDTYNEEQEEMENRDFLREDDDPIFTPKRAKYSNTGTRRCTFR